MTGRDLVAAQLRLIGVLAPGESLNASEASDGLAANNRLLDSWSTQGLLVYHLKEESPLTLVSGQASYTLGASGDITTRPMKIEKALIRDGNTDYPVEVLSLDEYSRISDKSTQSTYPDSLYDDGGYPQRTIKLYPVPSAANSLVLFTRRPLTTIASLNTDLSFPPGYERALVFNGALELAPEYGRQVDAMALKGAQESLDNIKKANHRPSYLSCDPGLTGASGRFDINSGGYRR